MRRVMVFDTAGKLVVTAQASCIRDIRRALQPAQNSGQQRQWRFASSGRVLSEAEELQTLDRDTSVVVFAATVPAGPATRADPHGCYVCAVDPNAGPASGGTLVTLRGVFPSTIAPALRVRFGRVDVPARLHASAMLQALTPEHEPGVVSVEVAADGVHFSTRNDVFFTFLPVRGALVHPTRVPVDAEPSYTLAVHQPPVGAPIVR